MFRKDVSCVLFTLFLVSVAGYPSLILAADIYKCPLESGGFSFTDRPCQNAEPELYYKGTEEDKKRSEEYQQQREMKAQQAARQAVVEESRNHMGMLIKAGRIREAREHAAQNGLESVFDEVIGDNMGDLIALHKEISIKNQVLRDYEAAIDQQQRVIDEQQKRLESQDNDNGYLHSQLMICNSQNMTPKFCP